MNKILKIITEPNKILRQKSVEIERDDIEDDQWQAFCLDMAETMAKKDGIGLAAPQVGKNIRFIVINAKAGPIFMFNPKILKKSLFKDWDEEGCLSVPMVFGEVKRHRQIECCYFDMKAQKQKIKASGLMARVIQHEIDHLDGILFIDKARKIRKLDEGEIKDLQAQKIAEK